eukprot:CAMPEP_0175040130 /NCGR_PEP_ID=MMETSP0052_2-20121109/1063_1 /TAXON_ID=51329 ORGANISM="Polytomella parva, Strain SAG 63-3" /NCGR_SAMPLE_ID=MMETSP0052_2 /ASSEMBLY_ACC=CAM_ASM_000194 /LENGTH=588 /DNA_ID=CAMNT_0016302249 /DNA_START=1841 /DNA_END=3607 /DNA_ORIENTATION=-
MTLNPMSPSPLFSSDEMYLDGLVSSFHEHLNQIQISTNAITHILKSIESREKLMLNGSRDAAVIDRPLTSSKVNLSALARVMEIQRESLDHVVKEIYRIQDIKNANPSQKNIPSIRLGKTASRNLPNLSTLPGWSDGDDENGEDDEEEGEDEEKEERDEENEEENERSGEIEKEKEKGGEKRKKTSVRKEGEISKEMEEVRGEREMAKRKREAIPLEGEESYLSEEIGLPRKDDSYSSMSKSGSGNESSCEGAQGHDLKRQRNLWEGDRGSGSGQVVGWEIGDDYEATAKANRHDPQMVSVSIADAFLARPPVPSAILSKIQNASAGLPKYPYPYKSSKKLYDILSPRLYGIIVGGCPDAGGSNRGPSGALLKRNVCYDVTFESFWKIPNTLDATATLHEGGGGQGGEENGTREEGRDVASRQGSRDRRYRFEFDGGARTVFGAAATTAATAAAKGNNDTSGKSICSSAVIFRDAETEEILGQASIGFLDGTSNRAEFLAAIIAIKWAEAEGLKNVIVQGDSLLVVNQLLGIYKANKMQAFKDECTTVLQKNPTFKFQHVNRKHNKDADLLCDRTVEYFAHSQGWCLR